jgi:hypothetical protein
MYLFAAQGRVGGIKNLMASEIEDMLAKDFGFSNLFKTASTFGLQPVIIPIQLKDMFFLYVKVIRPRILAMNNLTENEYVFISYRGEKFNGLDKNVASWFRKNSFNVTTNVLRSLCDTQTHELVQLGRIPKAFEESMLEINGHSGEMSKEYYRRSSFQSHIRNGNAVFDIIRTENMPENSIFANPELVQRVDYGREHPNHGKVDAKRIKWTNAEINLLVGLLNRTDVKNSSKPFVLCLQIIKSDPSAHRIFHEHHLSSHQRLRVGHQMYVRGLRKTNNNNNNIGKLYI